MEGLRKLSGDLIKARREKAQEISNALPKGGYAPTGTWGRSDLISRAALEPFQKKYALEIQRHLSGLSKISGLTETELHYLFGRVMNGYVSLLRRAPLGTRAEGSPQTLPLIVEEASHDLPALLSDFEVTVRQVKQWSPQITSSDKLLILRMMRKNNPYILKQLSLDPELQAGAFSLSEIKLAVREHKDAKKFLLDSLNILGKLTGDAVISEVFSRPEIRRIILTHTDGEKFLRSIVPFVQRGKEILEAAGLNAEAPKKRLYDLIGKEFEHKNRTDRINVLLQTIEKSFGTVPYATFVKNVSEMARREKLKRSHIGQQVGSWIIPKVALDLYFDQFNSQNALPSNTGSA